MRNNMEDEYIKLMCQIYPNLATVWGISQAGYNDFTKLGKKKNIQGLKELSKKISDYTTLSNRREALINSIDKAVYELESPYSNTLYYRYSMSIKSLMILWENYNYYKYGMDEKVLNSRLDQLPVLLKIIIDEIEDNNFSYLDLLYTYHLIKQDMKALKSKHITNLNHQRKIKDTYQEIDLFLKYIKNKLRNNEKCKIYSRWDDKSFITHISKMSGWDISSKLIEDMYFEALYTIEKNKDNNIFNNIENEESNKYKVDKNTILNILDSIYKQCRIVFGEYEDITSTITLIDTCKKNFEFGKFQYIKSSINESEKQGCLLFSSENNIDSIELLKLKLIHEIYPGHHYSNIYFPNSKMNSPYEKTRMNIFFQEGWAKYCERYFAYEIDKSDKMIKCYEGKFMLTNIMFIVVINIHYFGKSFKDIHSELLGKCGLTKEKINSLIMSSNVEPINSISYYIGYKFISDTIDTYSNKKVYSEIFNDILSKQDILI